MAGHVAVYFIGGSMDLSKRAYPQIPPPEIKVAILGEPHLPQFNLGVPLTELVVRHEVYRLVPMPTLHQTHMLAILDREEAAGEITRRYR